MRSLARRAGTDSTGRTARRCNAARDILLDALSLIKSVPDIFWPTRIDHHTAFPVALYRDDLSRPRQFPHAGRIAQSPKRLDAMRFRYGRSRNLYRRRERFG